MAQIVLEVPDENLKLVKKELWLAICFRQSEILDRHKGRRIIGTMTDHWNKEIQEKLRRNGIDNSVMEEKKIKQKQSIVKRIQAIQNGLKRRQNGTCLIHISARCENTIREMRELKWREAAKEEKEVSFHPIPCDRWISAPMALSFVVAKIQEILGRNIYNMGVGA